MISSSYPIVGFDQMFRRIDRLCVLDDFTEYSCVGVRLTGRGAYLREVRQGVAIKRKKQSLVQSGDVMYNKLFAWRGAFAIADESVHGCIASDKFPLYQIDTSIALPEYVRFWFQSRHLHSEARRHSKGAAALSKFTLNPPDFWRLGIPLPSIAEQERVVARLSSIFGVYHQVAERRTPIDAVVQGRRAGIGSEPRLVFASLLHQLNCTYGAKLATLDSVLTLRPRSGPSFVCTSDGPGIAVVMPSALGGYRYDPLKAMSGDGSERTSAADLLAENDILISRGNKRDQVGLCIVYPGGSEPRTYANLLMKMQVNAHTSPAFVKYWLMSPLAVRYIRKHTKGTSPSVQKINQRALINLPFPDSVPMREQLDWVQRCDKVFQLVEETEAAVREQYEMLRQLPDVVLTAAFKGEM